VTDTFEFSLTVRYMEVDAQGVVFNAWYLTYFDEAFTAFLESRGLGYQALRDGGLDFQLVHADIDWKAGLRFQDTAVIAVSTARLGRTSFAIDFQASRNGDEVACSARIVYVAVATDGSGKREIAPELAAALGAPAPLRPLLAPSANRLRAYGGRAAGTRLRRRGHHFGEWNRAMDHDTKIRTGIEQHWSASESGDGDVEHAIYADDAILDYPQSGERFRGRSKIEAQRGGNPAERHFTVLRISGGGGLWVSECIITYDGAPTYSVSIMEFTDDLVKHETQYFADPFPAPASRAALAEKIPGHDQV